MDINKNDILIYTDGSSIPKPRRGGIGIRIITIDHNGNDVIEDICLPGYKQATNNEMELNACILALKEISDSKYRDVIDACNKIIIKTDSRYVVNNFSSAKYVWPKNKWQTKNGTPVLNTELWKKLLKISLLLKKEIEIEWIKGHATNLHNRAADKTAKLSAGRAINKPLTVKSVRRKSVDSSVEIGSVSLEGQDILIRVRECEYLKTQKVYKLKYEVIDVDSPYFGKTDLVYSKILLKDGHIYVVTLNSELNNPRIEDLQYTVF